MQRDEIIPAFFFVLALVLMMLGALGIFLGPVFGSGAVIACGFAAVIVGGCVFFVLDILI